MPKELKTIVDLRAILNELAGLLDQLDELKEKEIKLSKKREEAENLVLEIGAEFNALWQGEQRRANRLRDEIQAPKDQLSKIKNFGTGYSTIIENKIKALETQIEGNATLEKKRADLLSKPVKLDRKFTAEAEAILSGIRGACAAHDLERGRLHTEIIHACVKLCEDARTFSRCQGTNYPDCCVDSLYRRLTEYIEGVYLRG